MPSLPTRLRLQFDAATGDRIYLPMLLFVMTVAVSVRLGVTFFTGLPWISGDTAAYFNMADAILAGHPDSFFPTVTRSLLRPSNWCASRNGLPRSWYPCRSCYRA